MAALVGSALVSLAFLALTAGPSFAAVCQYTLCREITVTPPADQVATRDQQQSFDLGSFVDSEGTGPWYVRVEWGDGSESQYVVNNQGTIPPVMRALTQDGALTVRVTVNDEPGEGMGIGSAEFPVHVNVIVDVGSGQPVFTSSATDSQPIQATVQVPRGMFDDYLGRVSIDRHQTTQESPDGFVFFDQEVEISVEPGGSADDPIWITLVYLSFPPDTVDWTTVDVFRNGSPIPACSFPSPYENPPANPDPCVYYRGPYPPDGAVITVLTSEASFYNVGYRSFTFPEARLLGPLKSAEEGTLNPAKAGSSVTMKFSLGGDQGLDVLASDDFLQSVAIDCGTGDPQGAPSPLTTKGDLRYDAEAGHYAITFKTEKDWASGSCRQVVLRLITGQEIKANFIFK